MLSDKYKNVEKRDTPKEVAIQGANAHSYVPYNREACWNSQMFMCIIVGSGVLNQPAEYKNSSNS